MKKKPRKKRAKRVGRRRKAAAPKPVAMDGVEDFELNYLGCDDSSGEPVYKIEVRVFIRLPYDDGRCETTFCEAYVDGEPYEMDPEAGPSGWYTTGEIPLEEYESGDVVTAEANAEWTCSDSSDAGPASLTIPDCSS